MVATVRKSWKIKSWKICEIFLSCDFSLQLGICVMASLINKSDQKEELNYKKILKLFYPSWRSLYGFSKLTIG